MGFGAAPTSLGKLTEVEKLLGDIKLKEGTNITITRDDPNNALEIAAAAGPYAGFGDHWKQYKDGDPAIPSINWDFDHVHYPVAGVGSDYRLYTDSMRCWGLANPHSCQFKITRGISGAGSPYHWFCIVTTTPDIHNNLNQEHIGFRIGSDDNIYCTNADGTARTQTGPHGGAWPPKFVKWVRSAADIKFYVDGALVATHITNLPTVTNSCIFVMQSIGRVVTVKTVDMTCPHYLEG